ncbi:hypothetical protein HZS_6057 [Henneguya salminicola]|nr:hypothetical protein HZS_6057 [Henneguya salminicola]
MRKMLCLFNYTEMKARQSFNNGRRINKLNCDLLLVHSLNDTVISHEKSQRLYNELNTDLKKRSTFILFKEQFGHNHIYRARVLPEYLM